MNYEVEINGRRHQIAIVRGEATFRVTLDGRLFEADVVRVDAQTLSLIVTAFPPPLRPGEEGRSAGREGGRRSCDVTIVSDPATSQLAVGVGSVRLAATLNGRRRWRRKDEGAHPGGPERVVAPMPGKIVRVLVQSGEVVRARQPLVVVEAMKMENELRAGRDGMVAEVHASEGQSVDAGALLVLVQ